MALLLGERPRCTRRGPVGGRGSRSAPSRGAEARTGLPDARAAANRFDHCAIGGAGQKRAFLGTSVPGRTAAVLPARAQRARTVSAQAAAKGKFWGKAKKVVLAYSGGLDTSIILKWLQDEYGCEVVTFTADLGQVGVKAGGSGGTCGRCGPAGARRPRRWPAPQTRPGDPGRRTQRRSCTTKGKKQPGRRCRGADGAEGGGLAPRVAGGRDARGQVAGGGRCMQAISPCKRRARSSSPPAPRPR